MEATAENDWEECLMRRRDAPELKSSDSAGKTSQNAQAEKPLYT